jgi:hypothetical protein
MATLLPIRRGRALLVEPMEPRLLMSFGFVFDFSSDDGTVIIGVGDPIVIDRPVQPVDNREDFVSFQLLEPGLVTVELSGLSGNADLALLDASGRTLARSRQGGAADETITAELPAGSYIVQVSNRSNDANPYELTLSQSPLPGDRFTTARDLGDLGLGLAVDESLPRRRKRAFYSFNVQDAGPVRLDLTGLSANADLALLDEFGRVIARSRNGGLADESLSRELEPGRYVVRVDVRGNAGADYRLDLRPQPGDAPEQALDLRTLGPAVVHEGEFRDNQRLGFVRFDVAETSAVALRLTDLTDDVDLQLLDAEGNVLARSDRGGLNDELIEAVLEPGSYQLRLINQDRDEASYELAAFAAPLVGDEQAVDLGSLVGSATLIDTLDAGNRLDVYQFTLLTATELTLTPAGVPQAPELTLLDALGLVVARTDSDGAADPLTVTLEPGTYALRVDRRGSADTLYEVTLDAVVAAVPDSVLDLGLLDEADTNLTASLATATRQLFSFTLDRPSRLALDLTDLEQNADVLLMDEQGRLIARSSRGGVQDEAIDESLAAGRYFVNVRRGGGEPGGQFDLTLSATPIAGSTAATPLDLGPLPGLIQFAGVLR